MILFLLIAVIVVLWLSAYGWRRKALRSALTAANLQGQLTQAEAKAETMTQIAREAIRESAKASKLNPDEVLPPKPLDFRIKVDADDALKQIDRARDEYDPDWRLKRGKYVAQTVAYCPSCNVSVRHDPSDYPVKCPACSTLIDPILDNPPEF